MTAAVLDRPTPATPPMPPASWVPKASGTDLGRLSRFDDAMVEVARALTEGIGALCASPCEVAFKGVEPGTLEGLPRRRGRAAVLAVAQAPAWNTAIAFHFDHAFVSLAVEALFGGVPSEVQWSERDGLSAVEGKVAAVLAEQVADAMTAGFAGILPTYFALEPIRPKPDPSLLGKPATAVLVATLLLHALGEAVELDVVIPQAALGAFGDRLSAGVGEAGSATDPQWSERFEAGVGQAAMRLVASLDLAPMTLGAIAGLKAGDVLTLPPGAGGDVRLSCGEEALFRCDLGQSSGLYTVRVAEPVAPKASSSRKGR